MSIALVAGMGGAAGLGTARSGKLDPTGSDFGDPAPICPGQLASIVIGRGSVGRVGSFAVSGAAAEVPFGGGEAPAFGAGVGDVSPVDSSAGGSGGRGLRTAFGNPSVLGCAVGVVVLGTLGGGVQGTISGGSLGLGVSAAWTSAPPSASRLWHRLRTQRRCYRPIRTKVPKLRNRRAAPSFDRHFL